MSSPTSSYSMPPAFHPVAASVISRELHQTAQPLTVLQGLLELALLKSHTTEEYKDIIREALEQSLRISGCFDHLRKLSNVCELPPDMTNLLPKTQPNAELNAELNQTQRIECVHV